MLVKEKKPQPIVGEAIVSILQAVGIDACFGVPGGQTLPFYQAARATGYNHVLMRDERNCACAADAYARVSGKVGICDATVGPGVTNLVSGLAEAYASSIPIIALIADSDRTSHLFVFSFYPKSGPYSCLKPCFWYQNYRYRVYWLSHPIQLFLPLYAVAWQ